MSGKARSRPSWKKQRHLPLQEVTVALIPVPADNLTAFTRDPELIDDQTLDDALRAPGVLPSREKRHSERGDLVDSRSETGQKIAP
jgi:hypothetical protein